MNKGFSLTEVLVLAAIIGILVSVIGSSFHCSDEYCGKKVVPVEDSVASKFDRNNYKDFHSTDNSDEGYVNVDPDTMTAKEVCDGASDEVRQDCENNFNRNKAMESCIQSVQDKYGDDN